jgi:prolyl-tRNA synthetase
VYATSWGVSTRLIGGLIMTHSDDNGLVLPPRLAPLQVVIIPIPKPTPEIEVAAKKIMADLKKRRVSAKYENDETKRPGFKFAEYEMRGVPVQLRLGMRDLENGTIEIARRDTGEKFSRSIDGIAEFVDNLLEEIQQNLFETAKKRRDSMITKVENWDEFTRVLEEKGGFLSAHWDGTAETEDKIKELTKATIRCIPLENTPENGVCVFSGKPSKERVLFAKSY